MVEVVKRLEIIEGRTPRVRLTCTRLGLGLGLVGLLGLGLGLVGVANFSGLGLVLP